LLCDEPLEFD